MLGWVATAVFNVSLHACTCVFKGISWVWANQRNSFENTSTCSKRMRKKCSSQCIIRLCPQNKNCCIVLAFSQGRLNLNLSFISNVCLWNVFENEKSFETIILFFLSFLNFVWQFSSIHRRFFYFFCFFFFQQRIRNQS